MDNNFPFKKNHFKSWKYIYIEQEYFNFARKTWLVSNLVTYFKFFQLHILVIKVETISSWTLSLSTAGPWTILVETFISPSILVLTFKWTSIHPCLTSTSISLSWSESKRMFRTSSILSSSPNSVLDSLLMTNSAYDMVRIFRLAGGRWCCWRWFRNLLDYSLPCVEWLGWTYLLGCLLGSGSLCLFQPCGRR